MTTTALFAELVVGGMQTLGWIAVWAMLWFPPERLLSELRSLTTSEGVIILIIGYSAGVVFDRLWDRLLKSYTQKIKRKILRRPDRAHEIRALVFSGDPVRANFIENIRIRLRVSRATLCNSTLTALAACAVWNVRAGHPWSSWLVLIGSFYALVAIVAAFAYRDIATTYYKTLLRFEP